jgi:hypothetical protein
MTGAFVGVFGPQRRKVEWVAVGIPLGAVVGYIEMVIYIYSVAFLFRLPL